MCQSTVGVDTTTTKEQLYRAIDETLNVYAGLETASKRTANDRERFPHIQPVTRKVGETTHAQRDDSGFVYRSKKVVHKVVDVPIVATLVRLLQHDERARFHCIPKSNELKCGEHWRAGPAEAIADIWDARLARDHPHLMRPATEDECNDLRLGIEIYQDGIEVPQLKRQPHRQPHR